jgi:uncharacterized CHY-type Zn-finger protein
MIPISTRGDHAPPSRVQAVTESPPTRVFHKPVPATQAQDPRRYHIDQLRKRFSPRETTGADGVTSLVFKLAPSDPDFPFELASLECDLRVPEDYPDERPALVVRNKDIPRGFGINIERGWDRLAEEKQGATLLALVHALDRNLERFLSEDKVDTIKLVAFHGVKDTRHLDASVPSSDVSRSASPAVAATPSPPVSRPYVPDESYTPQQIREAKARRTQEVRQLEARMGRMNLFRRSADGVVFTLPIEPKRRNELPSGLRSVSTMHLIVPLLYPLQNARAQLNEAEAGDAEPVEDLFAEKAAAQKHMSLMTLVNYLTQNLHTLAKQAASSAAAAEAACAAAVAKVPVKTEPSDEKQDDFDDIDRHIEIIPRPPEWTLIRADGDSESDSYESESSNEGGAAVGLNEPQHMDTREDEAPEKGTMITFPSVELYSIEILQISILNITVKCDRCKTTNDITGLRPGADKTMVCKKCTAPLAAKFRSQLVHEHSTRAGFLDFSGCKVADMLPSTFIPTCGRCSVPGPGLVSVRGESVSNVCRECHGKFTFKIPDVRFLVVTPGTLPPAAAGPRRRQEKLGLHAGEPLPGKGACAHYRKSYRWFRFSCCSKVHACDKCHDEAEDHINEWANRMICGWCSREQNYAVEACGFCGRSVIGRKGTGFWEGGRGTRDQRLMSRKDPRKHKRLGH